MIYKEEAYSILGACFEVYNELGCGFLESVYQEALEIELSRRTVPFRSKAVLQVTYKGETLKAIYQPDFVCFDRIILEIKAVSAFADEHRAQVHNYLKATSFRLGMLANFGHYPGLEYERIVR